MNRNGKVLTVRAGRRFPVRWVGSGGVAAAGAVLLTIDAVAVVADTQDETGLDQHPRVGLEISLHTYASKLRSLGEDLAARPAAKRGDTQHVLPCRYRLFENLRVNLVIERIVVADVASLGGRVIPVSKMLSQGE